MTVRPRPGYPAAARAVRAQGTVVVDVEIAADGSVISSNATSGHPLLRAASTAAAKKMKFEPSDSATRKGAVRYVFVEDSGKTGVTRVECNSRVLVLAPTVTLDVTETKTIR